MRRITMWLVSTVAALVLLFSYRTSTGGSIASGSTGAAANAPGIVSQDGTSPAPAASSSASAGTTSNTGGKKVVNGTVAQTRWGPVQVQVTISGGKITEITALQVPDGNFRDQEINSYAVPQLREEVLQAQSASIDMISGATITSEGYIESLQAALDTANFGK
jgi:uncharacterized protein with FMN-binding domain